MGRNSRSTPAALPERVRTMRPARRRFARHFVYILTCADSTFYTGFTTNPERRLREHNSGKASRYTRTRLPVRLSYLETAPSKGAALSREFEIKQLSRLEKMRLCREYEARSRPSSR